MVQLSMANSNVSFLKKFWEKYSKMVAFVKSGCEKMGAWFLYFLYFLV